MCSARRIRSFDVVVCSLAMAGLLLLASCKKPESKKEEPAVTTPVATQEAPRPGQPFQDSSDGKTYREVDCDCTDVQGQEKQVDLDGFLDGAIKAEAAGELKKYIDDHMQEKPLCLKAKKKQKVKWTSKSHKFQIVKFVNYEDDKDADLFDTKPPFPASSGNDGKSGALRDDAPAPPTGQEGKCYLFKSYVRVADDKGGYLDIDPHVGTGCCK